MWSCFCSFGATFLIVNLLIKTDSTLTCVPCTEEYVISHFLKNNGRFGRYLKRLNFVCCVKFMSPNPD